LNKIAGDRFDVFSAGLSPNKVHPMAIEVMKEIDIDISDHTSDHLDDYLDKDVDVVITTCDDANESCPFFPGNVMRLHWSIDDPFESWNVEESNIQLFRETRNKIEEKIRLFLERHTL
tara:strand:+ start:1863 stop:2216 length:354 start_codon:yes stop_codon:yes gene_type:complete